METPFMFGKAVFTETFTNRTKDIARLKANFNNHINTILISPRRWGKSSLVKKVAEVMNSKTTKVITIDLFSVRDEEDFYKQLATQTIKATSNKMQEWVGLAKQFFKNITPKISLGIDPATDFEIEFDYESLDKNYKEILNLPEVIAKHKNVHIVICVDEFQNLMNFKNPKLFQKRLRAEWQHHHNVTYCLYGSKQHMMVALFEKQSNPFYKFGDVMYLQKIEKEEWIKFITNQFFKTKKSISSELAESIADAVKNHSYYVQQLSHLVWMHTIKKTTLNDFETAVQELIDQNALLYIRDTEELSSGQVNYLKAVAKGITKNMSSKDVMYQNKLGTSANVLKIRKVLQNKEMVDMANGNVYFIDPVYELWFKKNMIK
jgi:uncharacterized protein